jgi:hypothetical protein
MKRREKKAENKAFDFTSVDPLDLCLREDPNAYISWHAVLEAAVAQKLRFKAERLSSFFDRLDTDGDGLVTQTDLATVFGGQNADLEEMLAEEGCQNGITRDKFFELFLGKDFLDRKTQAETFARTNRAPSPRELKQAKTKVPTVSPPVALHTVEVPTTQAPAFALQGPPLGALAPISCDPVARDPGISPIAVEPLSSKQIQRDSVVEAINKAASRTNGSTAGSKRSPTKGGRPGGRPRRGKR